MKKTLKQLALYVSAFLIMSATSAGLVTNTVFAANATNKDVCKGVNLIDGGGNNCTEGSTTFATLAKNVVNVFSLVVGVVSVIMIIIGGFRYIVSNGDSNAVTGAKNSILYAIVGLVIVLFAQVIVRFVLTNATK